MKRGRWILLGETVDAKLIDGAKLADQVKAEVAKRVAELKARGVIFEDYDLPGLRTTNGIATGGGAKSAWFKDSEGNIMALIQSYQR